jgi:prolyl oligopeptidase
VDEFHGWFVPDPYRWLEDTSNPLVATWISEQNALTSRLLELEGRRQEIRSRVLAFSDYTRVSLPVRIGERTFIQRTSPGQEQPVLFMTDDGDPLATKVLLDPNVEGQEGSVALTGWTVDRGASLLAYALSRGGGDRQEIRIRDIETGTDFAETLLWAKSEEDLPFPNVAWTPDGSGLYYNRLPIPGSVAPADEYRHSQVYWHRVGTSQADDVLIHERPDDPDLNFVPIVTDDGRYLLLHAWRGLSGRHQVLYRPLDGGGAFTPILPSADAKYLFIGSDGDRLFFHTNAGAPRGRVIGIDLKTPQMDHWVDVVPEGQEPIARAYLSEGWIVLVTVRDSHHRLSLVRMTGLAGPTVELPAQGTVSDVTCDAPSNQLLVAFESFLRPKGTLRFDLATGDLTEDATPSLAFDASPYETEQDFVAAPGGTPIPVTVVHRAGLARDGDSPLLLYGYGGFNVNTTPLFDPVVLPWLELGGVFAIANPRGGGEYGEEWHESGRRHAKQTSFDDLLAAAGWLVDQGYTTPSRLAIRGESNGGLLVAACMLQRPDLFGAVVCSLPVTDMLRFPRFTIGHYWTPEYGDAVESAQDFETLSRYSPLENVRAGVDYPPILVTTGDGDDRVVPAHAMKFIATLQAAADEASRPRLLRVQHDVGHGLGKPTTKVVDLDADILAFLLGTIGTDLPSV